MSGNGAVGFGGFLLGLGAGWLLFSNTTFSVSSFALLLLIIGVAMILSGVLRWTKLLPGLPGSVGGIAGGLILALFLTQGFGFIGRLGGFGGSVLPYSAEDTRSFSGPLPEQSVLFRASNVNGPVTIQTWSQKEYSVEVTVIAKGIDQAEADRHLAEFKAAMNKQPQGTGSTLDLTYDYPDKSNPPYMVTVDVRLPVDAAVDLDVTSSNGQVTVSDVSGKSIRLVTSNGQLQLNNLKADTIRAESSNGAIRGRVDAVTCTMSTSNGMIELQMPVTQSGKYTLTTSNARISLVASSPAGYEITASTSNADIGLNLPWLSYTTNTKTYKSAKTQNLEAYPVKVVLDLRTSNANVDISTLSSATY